MRCLPDFLIIGAQKAGTSSLFDFLCTSPGVIPPCTKECHFLDGPNQKPWHYRSYFPRYATLQQVAAERGHRVITGEATPYYLFHPAVPSRAAQLLPHAQIIIVLRDPVMRAYSHYRHAVSFGFEDLSFEEAIEREPARLAGLDDRLANSRSATSRVHQELSYVARGHYAEQIHRWLEHFDRSQMQFILFEEMIDRPEIIGQRLAEFLRVPPPVGEFPHSNVGTSSERLNPDTEQRLRKIFAPTISELEGLLDITTGWLSHS
ncbi:MAG: sulfotransferase domain-containing protein [Planctomycetota bacterium]|jgi:hypothetical protein